jgi:hypothetical protein
MSTLQDTVDALAVRLDRAVAVDDHRFRLLVFSAHGGEVDPVRLASILHRQAPEGVTAWLERLGINKAEHAVHVDANAQLGMRPRWCVPLRFENVLLGYLWLVDAPDPLDADALAAAADAAEAIAPELYRERLLDDAARAHERRLVQALVAEDVLTRSGAAHAALAEGTLAERSGYAAVVVGRPGDGRSGPGTLAALERIRRALPPGRSMVGQLERHGLLIVGAESGDRSWAALDEAVAARLGDEALTATRGPAVAELVDVHRSHAAAIDALVVAAALPEDGCNEVVAWEGLGPWRQLVRIPLDERADAAVPAALRVLAARADGSRLLETLTTYLDLAGDIPRTAARLHVHRTSLYARLRRIERVTGADLRDGDQRLDLHMGLRLMQLLDARPLAG